MEKVNELKTKAKSHGKQKWKQRIPCSSIEKSIESIPDAQV